MGCERSPGPEFLAADFASEEMCSFQDKSDAQYGQPVTYLEGIRTKKNVREIFIFGPKTRVSSMHCPRVALGHQDNKNKFLFLSRFLYFIETAL